MQDKIAAATEALANKHNLSKARAEAVELTLQDLVERGEWPPEARAAPVPKPTLESHRAEIAGKILKVATALNIDLSGPLAPKLHRRICSVLAEY